MHVKCYYLQPLHAAFAKPAAAQLFASAIAAVFCSLGGGFCFAVRFGTDIQLLTSKLDESVYLSKSAVNSKCKIVKNEKKYCQNRQSLL